jgi:ABC-type transport system involved in multi-copper enzyme maturation permease subunit
MIGAVFSLELRRSRQLASWLLLVTALYGGLVAAVYPVLRDNMARFDEYMKIYPKAILEAFGMVGSLADPGTFWNTYVASMLWPIVAGIAGILLATRSSAADTERGWIELPLSGRLPRTTYLAAAIGVQLAVLAALAAATAGGVVAVGWIVGAGFDAGRFALGGVGIWLFGCAIAAVTTLLAVVTLSRGAAGGAVAGALLVMYLFRALATIQPDLDWLATFSAFHYLDPKAVIDEGLLPVGDVALFVGIAAAAWAGAIWAFARRDLIA